MYKKDLTLNNLQWLICLKTEPNQILYIYIYIYIYITGSLAKSVANGP